MSRENPLNNIDSNFPSDKLSLAERKIIAMKNARVLEDVEAEHVEKGSVLRDFINGTISLKELREGLIEDKKANEESGELELGNVEEMLAFLADLFHNESLAKELTDHEKSHLDELRSRGLDGYLVFRFFKDQDGNMLGRPGVRLTIPESGDENEIRANLKSVVEAPEELSDTDKQILEDN